MRIASIEDRKADTCMQRTNGAQAAFLEAGAVQCGFCTPGLIVATHDLLARNATLDESDPIHRGVFINRRIIKDRTIAHAIIDSYSTASIIERTNHGNFTRSGTDRLRPV